MRPKGPLVAVWSEILPRRSKIGRAGQKVSPGGQKNSPAGQKISPRGGKISHGGRKISRGGGKISHGGQKISRGMVKKLFATCATEQKLTTIGVIEKKFKSNWCDQSTFQPCRN